MTPWTRRSPEAAALLNPALLALVSAAAGSQYTRESDRSMAWPLIYLIAPMVLHQGTREALPRDTRTHLSTWVDRESTLRAGFPARAQSLIEPVREGLRFGMALGILAIDSGGGLLVAPPPDMRPIRSGDSEEIVRKAGFVGKWFAKAENPATVFALLGVAP
ncbi:three component ABC system middle component [Actinoallomurus sp. CA-150999]|uniref:three component ABC system middle component n=1 Tax=Actinoallomurus sp. CA-150999 TaxID=3239887 RepID=UPI003D8DC662